MAGREQFISLAENEQADKKTFVIFATKTQVGIGEHASGQFPVFRLDLHAGDERIIDNFSFTIDEACPEQESATVTFSQLGCGVHGLNLSDIRKASDVIEIGSIGEIVLRKFLRDGRQHYWASVHRDIRVRSQERLSEIAAS